MIKMRVVCVLLHLAVLVCDVECVVYRNGSTTLCNNTDIATVLTAVEGLRAIVYNQVHSVTDNPQHMDTDLTSNLTHILTVVDTVKVTINSEVQTLKEQLSSLQATLQSQIDPMTSRLQTLEQTLVDVSSKVQHLEASGVTSQPTPAPAVIGFTAYLTGATYRPDPGSVIPFDGVEFNHGNHYSTATSKFTCPVYGMYFFTFMLYSNEMKATNFVVSTTEASVMRDGFRLVQTCCENKISGIIRQMCGNSVVTECDTGQKVWIETNWSYNKIYGEADWRETVFSGFLVQTL